MQISQKPFYIPLVQKPQCCSVTCLQMILYRRLWKLYDLQDLALYFWVKIDEENIESFNVKLKTLSNFNFDEWISTIESEEIINQFFHENNLNLKAKSYKYSDIYDLKIFIEENLKIGNDLWLEYHSDEIHSYNDYVTIHDSLIESIFENEVVLVDPEYHHKPRIKVDIETLKKSISNHFWKETWIVVISNI